MNKLTRILAKVLDIKESEISDQASPETISSWDSFNSLLLASEIENEFGIKFTMDEVVAMKNVGEIKKVLKKYGILI